MFLILHGDKPIYQYNFNSKSQKLQSYFSIHASLDGIDYLSPKKKEYYLGVTKSQDSSTTYCYINGIGLKLLLIFFGKKEVQKKNDTFVYNFFIQCNRALVNAILNPLYKQKQQIKSAFFQEKVIIAGKQHLKTMIINPTPSKK